MNKDINKEIKCIISKFQNRYGDDLTINSNGIMTKKEECEYNRKYKRNIAFSFDINDIVSAMQVIPLVYNPHKKRHVIHILLNIR